MTLQNLRGMTDGPWTDDQDLEELILDPATNATAKCTAIRTLRELQDSGPVEERPPGFAEL